MNAEQQAQNKNISFAALSAIGIYVATFCFLKFRLFDTVKMGLRDLAIFDQAIWNLFRNGAPYSSLVGGNIMGEHTSFFLFLIAPFYLAHFGPKTLLFLEVLCVGLGAVPVYYIARSVLKQHSTAVCFSIAYLLYPVTGFLTMDGVKYGFHLDAFLPTLYLSLFYFLIRQKRVWAVFFILLIFCVKEDTSLTVCLIGIYALVFMKDFRLGCIIILLSILWFFIATQVIIPHFYGGPSKFLANYGYLGKNSGEILWYVISHPLAIFHMLRENGLFLYAFVLLAPFAFLSLLSSEILVLGLPALLLNLLSDPAKYVVPHSPVSWHIAPLIPFVVTSAIFGTRRLCDMIAKMSYGSEEKRRSLLHRIPVVLLFTTVTTAHLFYGVSPFSLSFWEARVFPLTRFPLSSDLFQHTIYQNSDRGEMITAIKKIIPEDASLSATFYIGSHFAHRRHIFWFPERSGDSDYVLVDAQRAVNKDVARDFLRQKGNQYECVYNEGQVFLYKKSD